MTARQLALFDLAKPAAPAPEWSPPEIDGECKHCGAPISSRLPMDEVNHGTIQGTCMTRHLTRLHARNAQRKLDPARRRDDERCMKHQGQRIPCAQVCFQIDYDNNSARATEAWGGDGWKREAV